jgi:hypothetical protein
MAGQGKTLTSTGFIGRALMFRHAMGLRQRGECVLQTGYENRLTEEKKIGGLYRTSRMK